MGMSLPWFLMKTKPWTSAASTSLLPISTSDSVPEMSITGMSARLARSTVEEVIWADCYWSLIMVLIKGTKSMDLGFKQSIIVVEVLIYAWWYQEFISPSQEEVADKLIIYCIFLASTYAKDRKIINLWMKKQRSLYLSHKYTIYLKSKQDTPKAEVQRTALNVNGRGSVLLSVAILTCEE